MHDQAFVCPLRRKSTESSRTACLPVHSSLQAPSSCNAEKQTEAVRTPTAQLEAFDQCFRLLLLEIQSPGR